MLQFLDVPFLTDLPFLFFLIEEKLIYSVSSYTAKWLFIHMYVWCSYVFFFRFFSVLGFYRILNIVPCVKQ